MSDVPFVIPLSSARAADVECVGPKAANLAALARAGLPTPGGFCLGADAYRRQIAELGMEDLLARYNDAEVTERRRISVAIRLALYERPVAPAVLDPLLAAWRAQRVESGAPSAVRSSALIEDRKGANFAGQFESFLGIADETAFVTSVRACWAALWTTNARR
jgi:phosphoenolpyruvate synthase/pyruvate phosphate dikinase